MTFSCTTADTLRDTHLVDIIYNYWSTLGQTDYRQARLLFPTLWDQLANRQCHYISGQNALLKCQAAFILCLRNIFSVWG